jgi:hypothetical protein
MPVNEFEKQVQERLDDFQLNPSVSVWKKVEEQIREKKRRRIIFFFILPVLLCLLGFSLYQFLFTGKKTEQVQQPVAAKKEQSSTTDQTSVTGETKKQIITGQQPGENKTGVPAKTAPVQTPQPVNSQKSGEQILISNIIPANTNRQAIIKKKNGDRIAAKRENSLVITSEMPAKQQVAKVIDEPAAVIDVKNGITKSEIPEKGIQADEVAIVAENFVSVKMDSTAKEDIAADHKNEVPAKKKKESSKIKWGIDLSVGLASNNKGTLSFAKALAFDNYSTSSPVTGAGNPSVIIPPSTVHSGPAMKLGVVAESQLSKRSSISAGLQYAYSSNRIKVGAATDTAARLLSNVNGFSSVSDVNRLYRGAQENNYTNKYHFIRLPLSWHLQINKGKKVPIQWNAGIAGSYLFTTNALVYNNSLGGIYYQDKKAFNKMHFDLGTGISFRFKTKNGSEWAIGPELSFDMSRLVKDDNKQYLMFGGIHAKMFLPKKKNK